MLKVLLFALILGNTTDKEEIPDPWMERAKVAAINISKLGQEKQRILQSKLITPVDKRRLPELECRMSVELAYSSHILSSESTQRSSDGVIHHLALYDVDAQQTSYISWVVPKDDIFPVALFINFLPEGWKIVLNSKVEKALLMSSQSCLYYIPAYYPLEIQVKALQNL